MEQGVSACVARLVASMIFVGGVIGDQEEMMVQLLMALITAT